MFNFKLEAWAASAPGLETPAQWKEWIQGDQTVIGDAPKTSLKQVPPMLRRRLSPLGKCAFTAALELTEVGESIPCVFVSRHGETQQTLELLQELVQGEGLSPTAFSLSVHNAISGLFSIVRKDTSSVTALAASQAPIFHGLLEACGLLQTTERVLCVFYEAPLPELYQQFEAGEPFTHALALLVGRDKGSTCQVQSIEGDTAAASEQLEAIGLIAHLLGLRPSWTTRVNGQTWQLKLTESSC